MLALSIAVYGGSELVFMVEYSFLNVEKNSGFFYHYHLRRNIEHAI